MNSKKAKPTLTSSAVYTCMLLRVACVLSVLLIPLKNETRVLREINRVVDGATPSSISSDQHHPQPSEWEPMPILELTRGNQPPPNCTYPYVAAEDIIVPGDPYEESDGSRRRIPRSVHLAWVSANDAAPRQGRCLHYLQAETFEKYKQSFPHYSVYFHDDSAVDTLLKQENWPEFPQISYIMQCAKMRGAMLVDIWRVLVLYRYGGFYADLDLWPKPDFTEDVIPPDVDFFSFSDAWSRPTQGSFAMAPGHPVGYYNVHEFLNRIYNMEDISSPKLVFLTGPETFKYGYGHTFQWDNIGKQGRQHGDFNTTSLKMGNFEKDPVGMQTNVNFEVTVQNKTMTYKEKIEADTSVLHWQREMAKMRHTVPQLTCKQYLYEQERKKSHFSKQHEQQQKQE